jgi:hypothetical protein
LLSIQNYNDSTKSCLSLLRKEMPSKHKPNSKTQDLAPRLNLLSSARCS